LTIKAVTDAVVTDTASRTASKATASEIRTAVGLAAANLDTQLGAKATSTQLAAVQTHGDETWATATTVGLSDIDGVNWEVVLAAILANAVGASEVTDSVVEYKRRDGLTTVATVTMGNTAGTRTTSVLVGE
jgi:phosphoribosylanthranilate isomerase